MHPLTLANGMHPVRTVLLLIVLEQRLKLHASLSLVAFGVNQRLGIVVRLTTQHALGLRRVE